MTINKPSTCQKIAGFAVTAAAAAVWIAGADTAGAYNTFGGGCRFDPFNDNDGLGIGFRGDNWSQVRRDGTEDGAARWNAGSTPQFTIVGYGSSTRDVAVHFDNWGAGGPVAQTDLVCVAEWGHYDRDPVVTWNIDVWNNVPATQYSVGGIHELGHSYGLDHFDSFSCDAKNVNGAALMQNAAWPYFNCSQNWRDPTVDDRVGQEDAHNG